MSLSCQCTFPSCRKISELLADIFDPNSVGPVLGRRNPLPKATQEDGLCDACRQQHPEYAPTRQREEQR